MFSRITSKQFTDADFAQMDHEKLVATCTSLNAQIKHVESILDFERAGFKLLVDDLLKANDRANKEVTTYLIALAISSFLHLAFVFWR